ncbi:MAG: helix-turn-helix domain-containing protein [Microgenomates group bacterium]
MKSKKTSIVCHTTMKILGDYWTIRILDELTEGELRFCDLKRSIEEINAVTLTNRLKRLEQLRMIVRLEETVDKLSVTYKLSRLGRKAVPFVEELKRFLGKVG